MEAAKVTSKVPNVVYIIADDLGYGDLSCYGQQKFQTPNIDRLAEQGMLFTQCYSGTTVSAPSRACLLSGLHSGHAPIRGNKEVQPEGQMALPQHMESIFQVFKRAGYTTGAFGKWGLGAPGTVGDPNRQGVDEFLDITASCWHTIIMPTICGTMRKGWNCREIMTAVSGYIPGYNTTNGTEVFG